MNQLIAKYNGQSLEYDKAEERDILARLGVKEGKQVLKSYERYSGKKTKQQLGYAFGGIVRFAANNLHGGGYTEREMYSLLLDNCGKIGFVNRKTGLMETHVISLSHCGKYETALFIDEAIRWLASEGCNVESPEEHKKRMDELSKLSPE